MGIFDKLSGRIGDIVDEVRIPDDLHRKHETAARALDRGNWDEALSTLTPTLVERPNITRTHHLIGRALMGQARWAEAVDSLERALQIRRSAALHMDCALALEKMGRLRDAEKHLRRALEDADASSVGFEASHALARVNLALDRADRAVREARRALKYESGSVDATVLLARSLLATGAIDEAAQCLDALDTQARDRVEVLRIRGQIEERRGRYDTARRTYEKAHEQAPELGEIALSCARMSVNLEDFELALTWLDKAETTLAGDPPTELHVLRGRALEHTDRVDDAARAFRRALEVDPEQSQATLGLGRIELHRGNPDVAGGYFQSALSSSDLGFAKEALWGLGASRHARGDGASARHLLEEALSLEADDSGLDSKIWIALGEVALSMGDAAQAVVAYQEARSLDSNADVKNALLVALDHLSFDWEIPKNIDGPFALTRVLEALADYIASDTRLRQFTGPAHELLTQMNAPLSMAIVGEFNAGKSTMVNALIGEDVLPMGVLPTTAHTGILRFGPRKAARINYLDGRRIEVGFDRARELMKAESDEIERLEFLYPHPVLRAVEYWDTPGFNAINERHEEVAAQALNRAEAILWVMDASQVLSQTEFERIDSLPDASERLIVVINKIDRLGAGATRDSAVEELLDYVHEHVGDQIAGSFGISALEAYQGNETASGSFDDFKAFLDRRIVQRAGQIKTLEVQRQLVALVFELESFQNEKIAGYDALISKLESILDWVNGEHAEFIQATEIETNSLRDQLDFMLQGIEKEISDAFRPSGGILGRASLSPEDRAFLLELLKDRLHTVLERGFRKQLVHCSEFESEMMKHLEPILSGLETEDLRSIERRVAGGFDEVRVLKALLEERIYRALEARVQGRIEAGGEGVLDAVESAQAERTRWRAELESLIPTLGSEHNARLAKWIETYFTRIRRLLEQIRSDLQLISLDARQSYDLSELKEIL